MSDISIEPQSGESLYLQLRQALRCPFSEAWFLISRGPDFQYLVPKDRNALSVCVMPVLCAIIDGIFNGYVRLVDSCGDPLPLPRSPALPANIHPSSVFPVATNGLLAVDNISEDVSAGIAIAVMSRLRRVTLEHLQGRREEPLSLISFVVACVVRQPGDNGFLYIENIPKAIRTALTPAYSTKLKGVFKTYRQLTTGAGRIVNSASKAVATLFQSTEVARQVIQEPMLTCGMLILELCDPNLIAAIVTRAGGAVPRNIRRDALAERIQDRIGDAYDDRLSYTAWAHSERGASIMILLGSWRHDVLSDPHQAQEIFKNSGIVVNNSNLKGVCAD